MDNDPMPLIRHVQHLNQVQLARRWSLSPRTLERWRADHSGPSYLKVGGRVLYRLADVEAFERTSVRGSDAPSMRHGDH